MVLGVEQKVIGYHQVEVHNAHGETKMSGTKSYGDSQV